MSLKPSWKMELSEGELGVLVVVKEFENRSWQSCIRSLDLADIFQQTDVWEPSLNPKISLGIGEKRDYLSLNFCRQGDAFRSQLTSHIVVIQQHSKAWQGISDYELNPRLNEGKSRGFLGWFHWVLALPLFYGFWTIYLHNMFDLTLCKSRS